MYSTVQYCTEILSILLLAKCNPILYSQQWTAAHNFVDSFSLNYTTPQLLDLRLLSSSSTQIQTL